MFPFWQRWFAPPRYSTTAGPYVITTFTATNTTPSRLL